MSHPTTPSSSGAQPGLQRQNVGPTEMTAWVGWIAFAGTMMFLLGAFHAFQGIIALLEHQYFLVGRSGLAITVSFTAWGWVHVVGGIIVMFAGVALFSGKLWARSLAVLLALASALVNITFLSAYPAWSALMILIDVLVIWALTVHGSELRD